MRSEEKQHNRQAYHSAARVLRHIDLGKRKNNTISAMASAENRNMAYVSIRADSDACGEIGFSVGFVALPLAG